MIATAKPTQSGVRAWFDLARAGNFPSVASNVLAALVLSSVAGPVWPTAGVLAMTIVSGCFVYAGGATLNDVADAHFDAQHRPERAIPRGAVTRTGASWIAAVELVVGLGVLVFSGASVVLSIALVATILVYDWIHKRWIGAVVLMAGCRVLLAVALASLPGHGARSAFLWWAGPLFVYIITLSLIARWEYRAQSNRAASLGRMVGRLLAFIPLIDAIALLLTGAWAPALACAAAVPLGKWAQRLAAST